MDKYLTAIEEVDYTDALSTIFCLEDYEKAVQTVESICDYSHLAVITKEADHQEFPGVTAAFEVDLNTTIAQILAGQALPNSTDRDAYVDVIEMGIGDAIKTVWRAIKNFFIKLWNFVTGNGFKMKKKKDSLDKKVEKLKEIGEELSRGKSDFIDEIQKVKISFPHGKDYHFAAVQSLELLIKELDVSELEKRIKEGRKTIENFCKQKTPKTKPLDKFTDELNKFVTHTSKGLIVIETKRPPLDGSIKENKGETIPVDGKTFSMFSDSQTVVSETVNKHDKTVILGKETEWINKPPKMKSKNPKHTKALSSALKAYQRLGQLCAKYSVLMYKLVAIIDGIQFRKVS